MVVLWFCGSVVVFDMVVVFAVSFVGVSVVGDYVMVDYGWWFCGG